MMKIERTESPPIIIGGRILLGQALTGAMNAAVLMYNWTNPENPLPGAIVGMAAQPLVFFAQVIYVNRYGVTT
jgi:hypothetical protein